LRGVDTGLGTSEKAPIGGALPGFRLDSGRVERPAKSSVGGGGRLWCHTCRGTRSGRQGFEQSVSRSRLGSQPPAAMTGLDPGREDA